MQTLKVENIFVVPENYTGTLEDSRGTKGWYFKGEFHRVDGPAIEWYDGHKEWVYNGKRHRIDGPAVELPTGMKQWFYEGKRHRINGPAIIYSDGSVEYWHNDIKITKEALELLNNIIKLKKL